MATGRIVVASVHAIEAERMWAYDAGRARGAASQGPPMGTAAPLEGRRPSPSTAGEDNSRRSGPSLRPGDRSPRLDSSEGTHGAASSATEFGSRNALIVHLRGQGGAGRGQQGGTVAVSGTVAGGSPPRQLAPRSPSAGDRPQAKRGRWAGRRTASVQRSPPGGGAALEATRGDVHGEAWQRRSSPATAVEAAALVDPAGERRVKRVRLIPMEGEGVRSVGSRTWHGDHQGQGQSLRGAQAASRQPLPPAKRRRPSATVDEAEDSAFAQPGGVQRPSMRPPPRPSG